MSQEQMCNCENDCNCHGEGIKMKVKDITFTLDPCELKKWCLENCPCCEKEPEEPEQPEEPEPGPGVVNIFRLGGTTNTRYHDIVRVKGGYAVSGYMNYNGEGGAKHDGLLVKYDNNLNVLSQTCFAGQPAGIEYRGIEKYDNGGFLSVGFGTKNSKMYGMYTAIDKDMNVVCNKIATSQIGQYKRLMKTPDDFSGEIKYFGYGYLDNLTAVLMAFDENIEIIKQIKFETYIGSHKDKAILVTNDHVMVSGECIEYINGIRYLHKDGIIVFDHELNLVKAIHPTGGDTDYICDIIKTESGYLVSSLFALYEFDNDFNPVRKIAIAGPNSVSKSGINAIRHTPNGGYIAFLNISSLSGEITGQAMAAIEFDKNFNIKQQFTFGSKIGGSQTIIPGMSFVVNQDGSCVFPGFLDRDSSYTTLYDGFVLSVCGDWNTLPANLPKFSNVGFNTAPGFTSTVSDTVEVEDLTGKCVVEAITYTHENSSFQAVDAGLIVDK